MDFNELGYLDELMPSDFPQWEALLTNAIHFAQTSRQVQRAQYIYDSYVSWSGNVTVFLRPYTADIENRILSLIDENKLQANEVFILEAEDAAIYREDQLAKMNDSAASGGKYIVGLSANYSTASPNNPRATFAFNVAVPGTYIVFCRTIARTATYNSFFVGMDTTSYYPIWDIQTSDQWSWNYVKTRSTDSGPRVFDLSAGGHSIQFQQREYDSRLDKIIIVNYEKLMDNL